MATMDNFILFEDELFEKGEVTCPKCKKGVLKPVFPEHKRKLDFECNYCTFKWHFDPAVTVE